MTILRGRLSAFRWRTRLTLWAAAGAAGLAVVMFAKIADVALSAFFWVSGRYPWAPFVTAPLTGAIAVWLTHRYCPGAQGSGIPQVIAATRLGKDGKAVSGLVSLRIALGKIGLGALALTGGFSAGREGPSVQVAASILHFSHRFLPHSRAISASDLVLAGGAAGIAAAFNTPLAGIVFAVEELGRRLETKTSGVLVSTIIMAGLVAMAVLGNYNYFGHLKVSRIGMDIAIPVLIYGTACGVLGGSFSRLLLWPQKDPHFSLWKWRVAHPVAFAGICGLLVALIGWMGSGLSYGSGYAITAKVVSGELGLPWHAPLTRYLATIVSYFSGIPGGLFAPSLAVGAALGASTSHILGYGADTIVITALCMAGFLAGVTQSPITAAIIVMEMVDGHGMVISLMAVSLIAKAISTRICPELYQQLALGFLPASSQMSDHAGKAAVIERAREAKGGGEIDLHDR